MSRNKEIAECLRLGLASGLVHVTEVVAWADSVIVETCNPEFEIIEIASLFSGSASHLISLLQKVSGPCDQFWVQKALFSLMLRKVKNNTESARAISQRLYAMVHDKEFSFPESVIIDIYQIDDSFELAKRGQFGTVEEATGNLLSFLERNSSDLDWLTSH